MKPLILTPHFALKQYIRHYVYYEIGTPGKWTCTNSAPPGCSALVITGNGKSVKMRENANPAFKYESVAFSGQTTSFKKISLYGHLKSFFVIFRPCGAYRLLGIHQGECRNSFNNIRNLLGSSVRNFEEELADQNCAEDIQSVVENYFLKRVLRLKEQTDFERMVHTVKLIRLFSHNGLLIKEICHQEGYSISRLERHMRKIVGVSPKQYQRIIRFNNTLHYINKNPCNRNWSEIANRFGFFDQAHFIREFKFFYGKTPTEFTEEDRFLSSIAFRKKIYETRV